MSESTQQPDPSPDSIGSSDEEMQPFVITMPDDPASGNDWYLWAAVLALLALVAFWPAINGTFLWDDDQYVTHNHALLDASGLKEIWKIPPGTIQYYPLTFTVFWVEHHIWENNALGYRVVNLLLHAGAAVVLWRILRRLKIPGAWAAAAIWAVHPLQAESVCWISECKNVLSGVLALGSVLFYLEFAGLYDPSSNRRTWNLNADWQTYAISAGLFLLAMLAKTAVVFLPLAILLILWWKGRLTFAHSGNRADADHRSGAGVGNIAAGDRSQWRNRSIRPGMAIKRGSTAPDFRPGFLVLHRQAAGSDPSIVHLSANRAKYAGSRSMGFPARGDHLPDRAFRRRRQDWRRTSGGGAVLSPAHLSGPGIFQRLSVSIFLCRGSFSISGWNSADCSGGFDRGEFWARCGKRAGLRKNSNRRRVLPRSH